jgi:hypothetical protein
VGYYDLSRCDLNIIHAPDHVEEMATTSKEAAVAQITITNNMGLMLELRCKWTYDL